MIDTKKLGNGKAAPDNVYPVVVPDNMGKGHIWNAQTNKYDIDVRDANGVKLNPDGSVGLAVSPDEGNLLELRGNGVYYGLTPEPDKRKLYVSTTLGNDSNAGTKASPLKTINGAFKVINNSGQHHEIILRAGESFELGYNNVPDTSISLTSYYDQPISDWSKVPYYRPESSTKWNRPTVYVRKRTLSGNNVSLFRDRINCRAFDSIGINYVLDDTDPEGTSQLTGNITGFVNAVNATVTFTGCIFKFVCSRSDDNYRRDAWLRVKGVSFLNCKFENKPDDIKTTSGDFSRLLYHVPYPSINQDVWIGELLSGGNGVYEPLTPIVADKEDFRHKITLNNVCTNLSYDKEKKAIFGCLPTWDIFNYS